MADDDNFDIDIYGDDSYQDSNAQQDTAITDSNGPSANETTQLGARKSEGADLAGKPDASGNATNGDSSHDTGVQQISSTGGAAGQAVHKQAPQQQGTKRKQGEDDVRPMDPGATAALMINDVNWWVSEEDIRGWANQSGCEDELNEVTFNEHKVNGKSKGQVYVQMQSPQAATALKHQIESLFKDQAHAKKPSAIFNPPQHNPFKTLPKDVPAREKGGRSDRSSSGNFGNQNQNTFNNNRFNNNRGGFNNRGGMGFNNNRNFSGPPGGNMGGNMNFGGNAPMNNFGGNTMGGGMNNFGGGFNRGGMMGNNMRGGMGGRGRGGMGMNNMGGMNMSMGNNMMGMGGGMGMMGGNMGMMGGMGGGFGNQPSFNPGFFNQQQSASDNWGNNPHGAKRPRPE